MQVREIQHLTNKQMKNRRNLSIKQSWDKPKLKQHGLTTTNSGIGKCLHNFNYLFLYD